MGRAFLNNDLVLDIKNRLWAGDVYQKIADRHLVSNTTISAICQGKLYPQVPWPDGTTGAMTIDRQRGILEDRRRARVKPGISPEPSFFTGEEKEQVKQLLSKELEVEEIQATDWEEIVSILGTHHPLARQGKRDVFIQETICRLVGGMVVGQRSKEVIERIYRQELKRKELERKKQP